MVYWSVKYLSNVWSIVDCVSLLNLIIVSQWQEFDPQEFSSTLNESTQDADRGVVLNFMSSSHMPYILNRLQISLEADDEGM